MADKKQLTFLVIDADSNWRDLLGGLVSRRGGRVLQADNGNEGYEMAANEHPDFIVLSVELPDENGYVICKKIKSNPELKEVPLMLISQDATEEDFVRHQKLKVRADSYMKKPFSDEEFTTKVYNIIGFSAFGDVDDDQYGKLEMQMHAFLQEQQALERRLEEKDKEIKILEEKLAGTAQQFMEMSSNSGQVEELENKVKEWEEQRKKLQNLLEEALKILGNKG